MTTNTSTTDEELDEYLCIDCACPESYHSSLKKRVCHKHHETPCAGFDNGLKKPDDPLDKIITAYFIAVTYINEYGGSGKSDKQGEEAYKEARDEARQALLALIEQAYKKGYIEAEDAHAQITANMINKAVIEARQQDDYGNPVFTLNRYEAERVAECLEKLRANHVQGYDTGDWFLDVPRKVRSWLAALKETS